jgi:hypothetical protein
VKDGQKQFDHIDKGDVVILPAFGATIQVRSAPPPASLLVSGLAIPTTTAATHVG